MLVRQWITSRRDHYNSFCMLRDDQINRRLSAAFPVPAWAERNMVWLFPPRGDTEISEDTLLLQSHHLSQNNNSQHFNSISHSQFLHDSEKMNGMIGVASSCKGKGNLGGGKILLVLQLFINSELMNCTH